MNIQPQGFVGCSITFAIHFIAAQVARQPFLWLAIIVVGAAMTLPAPPLPPSPPAPSVPPMALMKQAR